MIVMTYCVVKQASAPPGISLFPHTSEAFGLNFPPRVAEGVRSYQPTNTSLTRV